MWPFLKSVWGDSKVILFFSCYYFSMHSVRHLILAKDSSLNMNKPAQDFNTVKLLVCCKSLKPENDFLKVDKFLLRFAKVLSLQS